MIGVRLFSMRDSGQPRVANLHLPDYNLASVAVRGIFSGRLEIFV
jgi:hypothetical protein